MTQIDVTATLLEQLIDHEGLRLKPYTDTVGKLTIGVGRNLDDVGITSDEAMILLKNDVERTIDSLDRRLDWWRNLNASRQRALISMAFNLGIGGLLKFKKALFAMQEGRWLEAQEEMLNSKWATQVGRRAETLAQTMFTGSD